MIYETLSFVLGGLSFEIVRILGKEIINYYSGKTPKSLSDTISVEFHKVHKYPESGEIDFINALVYTGFSSKEEFLIFLDESGLNEDYDYFICKESIDVNSMEEKL
ncbi:hypothetical protein [Crocosphaera sp.]|uniref:hypothetical protein n=1 Tax=Crocosphaera sp. TaxID=2729996 RepID=UPI00261456B0|nr:hypothetical protein [Crocosphaera sp.]MDJ0582962.1 hypothetical protein [Crocosphaera sp.]